MKTCKDCIYWANRLCHLHPQPIVAEKDHWCGQLKEKVHVISDFDEELENVRSKTD